MKYRKLPVVIDAEQWFPDKPVDGVDVYYAGPNHPTAPQGTFEFAVIETLEGIHDVTPGDYIITGIKGEKYPCKPDIFEATYERVEE